MRDIGRGDLDPLGRGGGGMLFNPPFNNPSINQPRGPDRNPLPGLFFVEISIKFPFQLVFVNCHAYCELQVLYLVPDSIHSAR